MPKTLERKKEIGSVEKRVSNGNGKKLSHEQFVIGWQKASNFQEFLAVNGLEKIQAKNQFGYLRKKGVSLLPFSDMSTRNVNVEALNKIIRDNSKN